MASHARLNVHTDGFAKSNALRLRAAVLGTTCLFAATSFVHAGALPGSGHFVSGKGEIGKAGQSLTVKQSSTTGIVDWKSFSIGAKNNVTFDNGSGATLNRVTGGNLSTIAGSLRATGSLYLMNSQGVIVSGSGRVVTGGNFVATSGTGPNDDRFKNFGARVVNRGTIIAGGNATLAGSNVRDTGTIHASQVDLDAAQKLTVDGAITARNANGSGGTVIAMARHIDVNGHADISANGTTGGTVLIGGDVHGGVIADDNFVQQTVRTARTTHIANGATISADASQKAGGDIVIWSDGHTTFDGKISATGVTNGGFAEVSSHDLLGFTGGVNLTTQQGATGTLLLDPENVTITNGVTTNVSLTGGIYTPTGDDSVLNAVTLEAALQTASVKITTGSTGAQSGDIAVLAPLSWSGSHTLTLDAFHSVIIGANISIAGGGGLAIVTNDGGTGGTYSLIDGGSIDYGATNNGGTLKINGTSYKLVYSMAALQGINSKLTGDYALATSLDGSSTTGWIPLGTNGANVIENSGQGFTGIFDGLGNTISGLKINLPTVSDVGLFGYSNGTIRDIGLIGGSTTGESDLGSLVGFNGNGNISNAFSTGTVTSPGGSYVGGLIGLNNAGAITNAFSTGSVTAATSNYVGGLIGDSHGSITEAFSASAVNGGEFVGGLVGYSGAAITYAYATGAVHGSDIVGSFMGYNESDGTVDEAYATGAASANTANVGGFVGENAGVIGGMVDVAVDTTSNPEGFGNNVGGTITYQPLPSADMFSHTVFSGWTFGTTPGATGWVLVDLDGSLNNAGNINGGTMPMLLTEYSLNIVSPHQLQLMELNLGAGYTLAGNINMSGTAGGDVWGAAGFVAVGGNQSGAAFTGTFAGDGNTISHLTIDDATNESVGLFGDFAGNVDNLKLTSVEISVTAGGAEIGGFAGTNEGSVTGVSVSGNVTGNATAAAVGGLVGENAGGISAATSSAVVADIAGDSNVGGLAGGNSATITNSSASGKVTGVGFDNVGGLVADNSGSVLASHATGAVGVTSGNNAWVGGLVGYDSDGATIASSYATGKISGDASFIGGLVGHATVDSIVNSYATGAVSGTDSKAGGLIGVDSAGGIYSSHATGKVTVTYSSGTENYAGGLVGEYDGADTSEISGSYATGAVTTTGPDAAAGGLLGYATKVQIASSYATGKVSASDTTDTGDYAGGLVGDATTDVIISDAYATGSVTGDAMSDAGGLLGFSFTDNTINNAYATGKVTGFTAGGLIGLSSTGNVITNSHATGAVTGAPNGAGAVAVGGLIGQSSSDALISSDYATGNVNGETTAEENNNFAGGLIGFVNSGTETITSSYATGSVSGSTDIGGLLGDSIVAVLDSYATGNVTGATSANAGGLAGADSGSISYSYATGNVTVLLGTDAWAGGLVGWHFNGVIDHSFATGNVMVAGTDPSAGGLVGVNSAALSYDYATGTVTGDGNGTINASFGGLTGANSAAVTQVYAVGDVSGAGSGNIGGLIGNDNGTVTAGYWDTQTTGQSKSAGGVGLTTAQLQAGLPKGFSSSDWAIVVGKSFPYLRWQVASGTPEVISGTISGPGKADISVGVQVNGTAVTPIVTMSSGANGYYYELLAPGTIPASGGNVLVYEDTGANHSDAFVEKAKGSLAGIDLAANTLTVDGTASSETSLFAAMENALGSSSGSDFLYTSAGNFTSGIDLDMNLSASSFSLDHAINIGTGDLVITAAGAIQQVSADAITANTLKGKSGGAAEFNSATNAIADLGAFTAGTTFQLTDDQSLTVNGAINAGTHVIDLTTVGGSHNLAIHAKLTGSTINLATTGEATESAAGAIDANLFNVSAVTGIELTSKKNKITTLGTHTTTSGPNKVTL